MKHRCTNPNGPAYKDYGGRGIKVCNRWLGRNGFSNFVMDMGDKPTPKHSLERRNNNKGYSPKNCGWATKYEQAANKRNSNKIVGVSHVKLTNRWHASLTVNGVFYQAMFTNREEAIVYRKELELRYLQ